MSKFDKWIAKYMGKVYPDNTELVSTGLEYLWYNPRKLFEDDRPFLEWLIGALAG